MEFDQTITYREGKGTGHYSARNAVSELEYGVTNRFTAGAYLKLQSLDTSGLSIDACLPGEGQPRTGGICIDQLRLDRP